MTDQGRTISEIRAYWGVGIETSDKAAETALRHMRKQMSNALVLLSEQLYASSDHYLLELLQNSDDNTYSPDVKPSAKIALENGRILFINNEIGFTDRDVRALCAVGDSTKKGKKDSNIGEKGIGFKAVFKVSDQPEIHSQGFHFKFNRQDPGGLGMVVPEWISGEGLPSAHTTIILPLAQGLTALPLSIFSPEILLFLRKIRLIVCQDDLAGEKFTLRREDSGQVITVSKTLTHGTDSNKTDHGFFVHRRSVDMSNIQEKLRPGIQSSDVVIALPLNSVLEVDASTERNAFAFLPVEDSRFRFVIHADFVLSTSRESIQRNLPWNCLLRDNLGNALADAIMAARSKAKVGRTALKVLANPTTVTDTFFAEVLRRAINDLKHMDCVLTEGAAWRRPTQVFLPSKFSALIGEQRILRVHKKEISALPTETEPALRLLGCSLFGVDELLTCLQDVTWVKQHSATWFLGLYRALGSANLSQDSLNRLQSAPILLLSTGEVAALSDGPIFYSLSDEYDYGFEDDLRLLNPFMVKALSEVGNFLAKKFLQDLGIRTVNAVEIIDRYILPLHCADEWKNCAGSLIGQVRFVRDHLEVYLATKRSQKVSVTASEAFARLRIRTAKKGNDNYWTASNLYLGSAYEKDSLAEQLLLERIPDRFISNAYSTTDVAENKKWSSFFKAVGCSTLPRIVSTNQWPSHIRQVNQAAQIEDFVPSEELTAFLKEANKNLLEQYLLALNSSWSEVGHKLRCVVTYGSNRSTFSSSVLLAMSRIAVASSNGQISAISGQYLDNDANRAAFGDGVPYLRLPLRPEFIRALGIVELPTVEQAIKRLKQLSSLGHTTFGDVSRLYSFLEHRFEDNEFEVLAAFEEPVILSGTPGNSRWITLSDCCWEMPRDFRTFTSTTAISQTWGNHSHFFLGCLRVRTKLGVGDLIDVLECVRNEASSTDEISRLCESLYVQLARSMRSSSDHEDHERSLERLRSQDLFWTKSLEWWGNDGAVYLADDPTLEQLFDQSCQVAFLNLPRERLTELASMLGDLGLQLLSRAVIVSPLPGNQYNRTPAIESCIAERLPLIVRLLYHQRNKLFSDDVFRSKLKSISNIEVGQCEELMLKVSLKDEQVLHAFQARIVEIEERLVLLVSNSIQVLDYIAVELTRFISDEISIASSVSRILVASSKQYAEDFLDLMRVPQLPPELLADFGFLNDSTPSEEEENCLVLTEETVFRVDVLIRPPEIEVSKNVIGALSQQLALGEFHHDENLISELEPTNEELQGSTFIPPILPDHPSTKRFENHKVKTGFVSYIRVETGDQAGLFGLVSEAETGMERATIEAVIAHERKQNRTPEVADSNPGFDLKSFRPDGCLDRYIKVKGLQGEWDTCPVTLSKIEFDWAAETNRDAALWLYIVESVFDSERQRITTICEPCARIARCSFDFGWRSQGEPEINVTPETGASWSVGGQLGTVTEVVARGKLIALKIQLEDGSTVMKMWSPVQTAEN